MTHKFCPHCAAKNYFEIEPKFCTACGKPLSAAVAVVEPSAATASESDENDDFQRVRKPAKLEVDIDLPEEQWEKFGSNIATAEDPEYGRKRRQEIAQTKPEYAKDKNVLHAMRDEFRLKRGTVGGED